MGVRYVKYQRYITLAAYSALNLPNNWYLKLFIVYILALLAVFIVNNALDTIEKKRTIGLFKFFRG